MTLRTNRRRHDKKNKQTAEEILLSIIRELIDARLIPDLGKQLLKYQHCRRRYPFNVPNGLAGSTMISMAPLFGFNSTVTRTCWALRWR
jgi:hypothetical protein